MTVRLSVVVAIVIATISIAGTFFGGISATERHTNRSIAGVKEEVASDIKELRSETLGYVKELTESVTGIKESVVIIQTTLKYEFPHSSDRAGNHPGEE